jgi:hypothetical protein
MTRTDTPLENRASAREAGLPALTSTVPKSLSHCTEPIRTPPSTVKKSRGRPRKPLGFLSAKRYAGLGKSAAGARFSDDFTTFLCGRFPRPSGYPRPHHQGHPVTSYRLAKGSKNIRNAGRWYAQVCDSSHDQAERSALNILLSVHRWPELSLPQGVEVLYTVLDRSDAPCRL